MASLKCGNCDEEVTQDMEYCPNCGEPIGGDDTPEPTTTQEDTKDDNEKDDSMSTGMKVGITLVVLVVIILALGAGGGGSNVESPNTQEPSTDTSTDGNGASGSSGNDAAESGDELITHEMGETFTVGSGDRTVQYTVKDGVTADAIGQSSFATEPDGTFVVVTLEIENTASEPFPVTTNHLKLVSGEGNRYTTDSMGSTYVGQDGRFADSIVYEDLQPGLSIERSVVFDVPQGEYVLEVQGTDFFTTAEPHYVPIGQVG